MPVYTRLSLHLCVRYLLCPSALFVPALVLEWALAVTDPLKLFQVECDGSKVATGAVLRQQSPEGFWHPCAFLLKSFTEAEWNYQIYDCELLAIV